MVSGADEEEAEAERKEVATKDKKRKRREKEKERKIKVRLGSSYTLPLSHFGTEEKTRRTRAGRCAPISSRSTASAACRLPVFHAGKSFPVHV